MAKDFESLVESDEIDYYPWPDCVQIRPDTYIGGVDKASMDVLLREIIDNSTDECYQTANKVIIDRAFNGMALVADNGRGISIEYNKKVPGVISADLSISSMHSGAKFPKGKEEEKLSTSGKNGVGSSCVNALSDDYILMSWITPLNYDKSLPCVKELWDSCGPRSKKDLFYIVWYKRGVKYFEGAMKKKDIENMLFTDEHKPIPSGMSTIVMFRPNGEIFTESQEIAEQTGVDICQVMNLPLENLQNFLLIQEKFLKKQVNLLIDGVEMNQSGFNGFGFEFIKSIKPTDQRLNKTVDYFISFDTDAEISSRRMNYCGSVNGLVVNRGKHIDWVEKKFCEALKSYFNLNVPDRFLNCGLRLYVLARASETSFSSQTKEELKGFPGLVQDDLSPLVKEFQKIFKNNEEYWANQVERLYEYAASMKSLSTGAKAKQMINSSGANAIYKGEIIKKFADATVPDRTQCELFLCEGDSAASGLKGGRMVDPILGGIANAIMPLRGKILNVKESDVDRALENKEINTIFRMLGVGIGVHNCLTESGVLGNYEEEHQVIENCCRFGKIVICTDGDPDGSHIQNLLLYLFAKFAPFMIFHGKVYICKAPLFYQDGKYYFPGDPLQPGTPFPIGLNQNKKYSRWKGLGSIPKEHIYNAFFNVNTRKLIQVLPSGIENGMDLIENLNSRKDLLRSAGIIG